MDYLWLQHSTQSEFKNCVYILTETWLNADIADSAIQLTGLACYQADRKAPYLVGAGVVVSTNYRA